MRTLTLATVTLLCAALTVPAFAKDKDKDQGNQGKADNRGNDNRGNDNRVGPTQQGMGAPGPQFVIIDRDRSTVSTYYRDEFARGNCPPGLAKKDNGCLPPGQAKKMWVVGQPLPPHVHYHPLPQPLYSRLTPPPPGYEYVRVDDDVLLMQTANRSIMEIVVNLLR